jgi:hypothetical protein
MNSLLSILFDSGEHVCLAQNKFGTRSFNRDLTPRSPPIFVCINPLQIGTRRLDENVASYRNLMFESDTDGFSLEDQDRLFKNCGLPWATIVDSGNKSLHAILSLETPLTSKAEYKRLHRMIREGLNKIAGREVIDKSNNNPSRFSRYPGTVRPETGRMQTLIHAGRRCSANELQAWFTEHSIEAPPEFVAQPIVQCPPSLQETQWMHFVSRTTLRFFQEGAPLGDRHRALYAATCNMVEIGLGLQTIVKIFEEVYPKIAGGSLNRSEFVRCIRNAFLMAKYNEEIAPEDELEGWVAGL